MIDEEQFKKSLKFLETSRKIYQRQVKEAKQKGTPHRNMMGVVDGLTEAIEVFKSLISDKNECN